MAFPALLPFLQAAGRVLGNAGSRAATAAIGKQGMAAFANLRSGAGASAGSAAVARNVTQQGMANVIGRGSSFGSIMSGSKSAGQEVNDQQQVENDRAAAEGLQQRKDAEEAAVKSAVLLTGALTGLGVAVLKVPGTLERFSRGVLAGQEGLRKFNGQINAAFAKLEFQDMVRARNTANATAGSTAMLAQATNQIADDTRQLKHAGITLVNVLATGAARFGGIALKILENTTALGALEDIAALIEKFIGKGDDQRIDNFFNDIAEGKFSGMKRDRKTPNAAGNRPRK